MIDQLMYTLEEMFFGKEILIDLDNTGRTVLSYIININNLRKLFDDMKSLGEELTKKTY